MVVATKPVTKIMMFVITCHVCFTESSFLERIAVAVLINNMFHKKIVLFQQCMTMEYSSIIFVRHSMVTLELNGTFPDLILRVCYPYYVTYRYMMDNVHNYTSTSKRAYIQSPVATNTRDRKWGLASALIAT